MCLLFNITGFAKPNLSRQATLAMECGFMRVALLQWWLETDNIFSTLVRGLLFSLFTFGKEPRSSEGNGP